MSQNQPTLKLRDQRAILDCEYLAKLSLTFSQHSPLLKLRGTKKASLSVSPNKCTVGFEELLDLMKQNKLSKVTKVSEGHCTIGALHQTFDFKLAHLPGTESDILFAMQSCPQKRVRISSESLRKKVSKLDHI